ncbi:MAG: hypothetical protein JWR81_3254, partial [Pseudonocardia sp.]|nr:hypothetical protein [Pseudonocardia sp.]
MRPATIRVALEPTTTVVSMSTSVGSNSDSGRVHTRWPGRPACRTAP